MRHRNKFIALSLTAALVVTACGSDKKDTTVSSATSAPATSASTATPETTATSDTTATSGSTAETPVGTSVTTEPGKAGGTFVFGASSDPVVLDGAYVSDGESLRVIHEIFETLVTTKPGGTDIVPLLADSWESSSDGLAWTFHLHKGIKFHD